MGGQSGASSDLGSLRRWPEAVEWVRRARLPAPALPWPVDAAIGTLSCLSLWWRRRWPLGLALALTPFGAVSASATAAVTVAVFTVAVRRRALVAVTVAVANVGTVAIYFLIQDDPKFPVWVDFAVRGGILTAAVGWGMFARPQRQLVASLRERAARLKAEQHLRVDQAHLTERTRIHMEEILGVNRTTGGELPAGLVILSPLAASGVASLLSNA